MPSKWDSGIIVWNAAGDMLVLKEGKDGVYVVDPNQKGCPVVLQYHDIMFAEHYKSNVVTRRKSRIPRAMLGAAIGGMPGAVWLGLSGASTAGCWRLRVKENDNGEDHIYTCRSQYDAKSMEKRIMKRHAHRRQPGEKQPTSASAPPKPKPKRNAPPKPPVGYEG